jgi:hypothetical protein
VVYCQASGQNSDGDPLLTLYQSADEEAAVASLWRALAVRSFKVTELGRDVAWRSRELVPTGLTDSHFATLSSQNLACYDQAASLAGHALATVQGGRKNFEPSFLRMARHQLGTASRTMCLA